MLTLAQSQAPWTWGDAFTLAAVGISVVFVALAVVGGIMLLLGRWLRAPEPAALAAAPPAEASAPAHATGLPGHVDGPTLAVLTAAAVAALGRPVRVRRVTFVNQTTVSAWKAVGRITIHASHNLRR